MNSITVWVIDRKEHGYAMRWIDPQTSKRRQRQCQSKRYRDAELEAGRLEEKLNEPTCNGSDPASVFEFAKILSRYKRSKMQGKSDGYVAKLDAAVNRMESVAADRGIDPLLATHITTEFIADVIDLIVDETAISSAKSYRATIKVFLDWAADLGLCEYITWRACKVTGTVDAGGRPVTSEEFDRMIDCTEKIVGEDRADEFKDLLRALWFSGMRLGEALNLNQNRVDCHHVERPRNRKPRLVFLTTQKNRKFQKVVMTEEFDHFIRGITPNDQGFYFVPLTKFGKPYTDIRNLGRVIGQIGQEARIATKIADDGEVIKFATAHDLRRGFAKRWSSKVKPLTLKHLMRHSDINTTLKFYAGDAADLAAQEVWGSEDVEINEEIQSI